jgi:hypothetical protein
MWFLPLLKWVEFGYRHWNAIAPEGGWYESFWREGGWVWKYHLPASYHIHGGISFSEADAKATCEEHRAGNRPGMMLK